MYVQNIVTYRACIFIIGREPVHAARFDEPLELCTYTDLYPSGSTSSMCTFAENLSNLTSFPDNRDIS